MKVLKTFLVLQAFVIAILLVGFVKAVGMPDGCIAVGVDGRYLCWQEPAQEVIVVDTPTVTEKLSFDLNNWKLQIPGPEDIIPINDYTSKYFNYGENGEMIFLVDSSEKGTTNNSSYVRSEFREMLDPKNYKKNWKLKGTHSINAEIEVKTEAPQVTVLQIHGIKKDGGSVKPLLRIAMMDGDLYAWLKSDSSGKNTNKILLAENIQGKFSAEIYVDDYRITVTVNGEKVLDEFVKFWKHYNYFKAGNYPQAHEGVSEVIFYKLDVKHK